MELYEQKVLWLFRIRTSLVGNCYVVNEMASLSGSRRAPPLWNTQPRKSTGCGCQLPGEWLADLAVAIQTGRDARCSIERPPPWSGRMTAILNSAEIRQTLELQTTCTQPAPLNAEEAQSLLR